MRPTLPPATADYLQQQIELVMWTEDFGDAVNDIAEAIRKATLSTETLAEILEESETTLDREKGELLNLLLRFIETGLDDKVIAREQAQAMTCLKRLFQIKEGDFFHLRYFSVEDIVSRQLERMYVDNLVDNEEALQKVELQALFDLSYDQFLQLSKRAVKKCLERGASVAELDTFISIK